MVFACEKSPTQYQGAEGGARDVTISSQNIFRSVYIRDTINH